MADQQLNKPLYKTEDEAGFTPPIPRHPRASMLGRGAALFLDIMLLHLVFSLIVRYAPDIPLTLGGFAPWVGLLLGFLYFGIGFSHLTLGRTLGKLITRVQVADIAGPDLPVSRALMRAALLLLPLPIVQIFRWVAEDAATSNPTSAMVTLDFLGWVVALGWFLGNAAFAALDPYKRTVYDRLTGSIVINAELEAEPVRAYLADARVAAAQRPPKNALILLVLILTVFTAFAVASGMKSAAVLKEWSELERDTFLGFKVEGYGRALRVPDPEEDISTGTLPLYFEVRNSSFYDQESLKADPAVFSPMNHVMDDVLPEVITQLQTAIDASAAGATTVSLPFTSPPKKARVKVSYVEHPDLFFARYSHPVYTLTKEVDISTSLTMASDQATSQTL